MEQVFNQGNLSLVDEVCSPNFVEHKELPPRNTAHLRGHQAVLHRISQCLPRPSRKVDDTIAEGDKVVVRATWSGTHKGEFMGIPPTGKRVSFGVIDTVRIDGGKLVEHWGQMDNMRLMQQLGAVPVPG